MKGPELGECWRIAGGNKAIMRGYAYLFPAALKCFVFEYIEPANGINFEVFTKDDFFAITQKELIKDVQ